MSSSYVEFRGQGFWSYDPFLEELLHRLADEISSQPPADWRSAAAEHWRLQSIGAFAGWIHPDFDEWLIRAERREEVTRLVEGIRLQAGAARHLQETCHLVEQLLKGELSTDASSPLDYMVKR